MNNVKPTVVSKSIGLSDAIPTKWKNGAIPKAEILLKLGEYFDCSVDYLLGRTENPQAHKTSNTLIEESNHFDFSEDKKRLLEMYANLTICKKVRFWAS